MIVGIDLNPNHGLLQYPWILQGDPFLFCYRDQNIAMYFTVLLFTICNEWSSYFY